MKKTKKGISVLLAAAFAASALSSFAGAAVTVNPNGTVFEAEDATLTGAATVSNSISGYSGSGYVGGFTETGATARFTFDIAKAGSYDIIVAANSMGKAASAQVNLDAPALETIEMSAVDGWQLYTIKAVSITEGQHRIRISAKSGSFSVDYFKIVKNEGLSSDTYKLDYELSNPNADDNAKRLFSYLLDNYGVNVISGQYGANGKGAKSPEYAAITSGTGEAPAIMGFDMMEYSPSRLPHLGGYDKLSITEKAIEWAKDYGGIVTFCWHWTPDEQYLGKNNKPWYSGFYTEATTFDIKAAMSGEDEYGYNSLIRDIDAIAVELQKLEDAGVPVLWRPLHEASGGWFWWGTDKDSCIELWKVMYDRLTNYHGLNNLIWVWNGQKTGWYPGDEYVDIIGEDIYADSGDTSSQSRRFYRAMEDSQNKMICLSENGVIPDIDNMLDDNIMWSWFGTWNGSYIQINEKLSDKSTPVEIIKKVYNHSRVITLSELPDWDSYPVEGYDGKPIAGDANLDETVDILDVIVMRSCIISGTGLGGLGFINADISNDGEITILDVVKVRDIIVN